MDGRRYNWSLLHCVAVTIRIDESNCFMKQINRTTQSEREKELGVCDCSRGDKFRTYTTLCHRNFNIK